MDVILDRCAGLDVHKKSVTACVRTPGTGRTRRRQETRTFGTFLAQLVMLRDWLASEGVTHVAMEATGVYWKPVWQVLEPDFELTLANPTQVKRMPGRKTDVKDAEWLAQLLECGLLQASFVPPVVIREARDLTRYRTRLVQERARESLRVQKVLEDAGIKLASVATDALGKSGRHMIEALIAGERDPERLADLALGKLRKKIPELLLALEGRFRDHHAFLLSQHLRRIDELDDAIGRINDRLAEVMAPFREQIQLLETIPGVGRTAAEVIVAEIGVDMAVFPTAGHLAKWAGMCPGNRESAGKQRSGKTSKGDPWLAGMLTECGWAARRTKETYLAAQFWQIARRRGREKACIAVGHSILVSAWHILTHRVAYQDLGGDWFTRPSDAERRQRYLVRQLEALGLQVTVHPTVAA